MFFEYGAEIKRRKGLRAVPILGSNPLKQLEPHTLLSAHTLQTTSLLTPSNHIVALSTKD